MDVIYSYTRKQAIEDGLLVDVTQMAREAGFTVPVAITKTVWDEYIVPTDYDKEYWFQDLEGRLWDTLWMLRVPARRIMPPCNLLFKVYFVIRGRKRLVTLKAVFGWGDDGEPVITIMHPDED